MKNKIKITLHPFSYLDFSEKTNAISFKREDESLTLTIEYENPLVVLFSLKPFGK